MTSATPSRSQAPNASWACRWCSSAAGAVVLDLGAQPAADLFPLSTDPEPDPVHPLRMISCSRCHLAQLECDPTIADEPRGVEPAALVAQAVDAITRVSLTGLLPRDATVLEHPSPHGGSWIPALSAKGLRAVNSGPADVVVDVFGMMHEPGQREAMRARAAQLADGGVLLLQFHTLAAILRHGTWNALRHGHFAYYSTPVLIGMAREFGLGAIGVWEFDLYGGTVMLAFRRGADEVAEVDDLASREVAAGVTDPAVLMRLQDSVASSVTAIRDYLDQLPVGRNHVAGYGAASRSVALLRMAGVGPSQLIGVADASSRKIGRCLPGVRIPIIAPAALAELRPRRVLLFLPDLLEEVRHSVPEVEAHGGRWVVLDPRPMEVEPQYVAAGSSRRKS